MKDWKRTFGLAAMAIGVLVAIGAVVAVAGQGSEASISTNVLVNPAGLISVNNSPTLVRDPQDADHLVVAHRIDRPGFSALLEWSDDAGASWTPTSLPLPADTEICAASPQQLPCPFAPDVAFGPDGTLYVLYVSLEGQGNTPAALWLSTSTDGGRSLGAPVAIAGELTFQPRLAVAGDGTVHVVWLAADSVGLNQISGPARVVAIRSTDGGRTFSAPVQVSDPGRERVGAASPVVDSDGGLVVLYEDFTTDRRDFLGLQGPVAEDPFALVVSRSDDGGQSFAPGVVLESELVPTRRFLVFLPEYPSLAIGADDQLYVSWADGRNADEDVFLRHSSDGGATWDDAVMVNDNPVGDGTDQYLPRVAVAPNGRVDVLFYDRRSDTADMLTDVFLASADGPGEAFTNRRVSSQSFSSAVGPTFGPDYGTDFGTRLGLKSTDDEAYAAWTDTRLGDMNTGRQDVFAATVTVPSSGLLGAAVVVVVLLGLGVGGFWLVRRRSSGATSSDAEKS